MDYTWSYSSIGLFNQCPHKYYRIRIKKDVADSQSEAMLYGNDMHKAAELYLRDDEPLPEKFAFVQGLLDTLKDFQGEKLCEYRMGLTRALEPCDYFAKDVWWRGIADLIILQGNTARVLDYKTGKSSKNADTKQLELLSLAVFKHFPQVQKVKGALLFVVANDFVKGDYIVEQSPAYWKHWLADTARLEKAFEVNVWNPRPNFTCNGWCPVVDCSHNRTKRRW